MKLNDVKFSKAIVLLILATSFVQIRHVFWVVTNPEFYTSYVGLIWIAGVVPYFLVVSGCILSLLNKRIGLATIVIGSFLSFFGASWSYLPYWPALADDSNELIALLVIGNLFILAILIWMDRRERNNESVAISR